MTLYNCRAEGQNYRMNKFDEDLNLAGFYTLTLGASGNYYCNCPSGGRDTCRHRKMLYYFIATQRADTQYYLDYENWHWEQPVKETW